MKKRMGKLSLIMLLAALCVGCGQAKEASTQEVIQNETDAADDSMQKEGSLDISSLTGEWVLDMDACEKNLQNCGSMQELFGTGLGMGNGLHLYNDNTMDYYIGIGLGGSGTYRTSDNSTISVIVKPYTEGEEKPEKTITFTPVEIDGVLHLTMPCYDETMYWIKADDNESTDTMPVSGNVTSDNSNTIFCTLDNPSWEYYFSENENDSSLKLPVLEEQSSFFATVGEEDKWFSDHDISKFSFPYTDEKYTYSVNEDFEPYILDISDASTGSLLYEYNFVNYRYADQYIKEDYDFICERICWAKAKNNILYVAIAHNTYADSAPHNGYLMAINMETNDVIWKTAPLTSNSWSCALVEGGIICGYGFTAEKDYLNVVDIQNGTIAQQIPLKSMAEYIVQKDQQIYVRTYDTEYVFDIK